MTEQQPPYHISGIMAIGKLKKLQSVTCATGIEQVVHADYVHVHNKYTTELLSANSAAIGTVLQ